MTVLSAERAAGGALAVAWRQVHLSGRDVGATGGGRVTLQFEDWTARHPLPRREQSWVCPYCFELNGGTFPFLLASVTTGGHRL